MKMRWRRSWFIVAALLTALNVPAMTERDDGFDAVGAPSDGPERKTARLWYRPSEDTPEAQLALARRLAEEGRLARAGRRCEALVRTWPHTPEAVAAQMLRAELLARRGQHVNAFHEYQYLVDFYAGQFDFGEVAERQFELAMTVMNRRRQVVYLWSYTTPQRALPLFRQLTANAPGGPRAEETLFAIGWIEQESGNWSEAIAAFETLGQRWPRGEFAASAAYARAICLTRLADRHPRDESAVRDALAALAAVLRDYPNAPEAAATRAERDRLSEHLATMYFERAAFYERGKPQPRAALIAYQDFLRQFPYARLAERASERIADLETQLAADGATP